MIAESVFIQLQGDRAFRHEENLINEYATQRKIPVVTYTKKQINRRTLPISDKTVVVGDVKCVEGALNQLGVDIPKPNPYPECLKEFLHRRVWEMTLAELESNLRDGLESPIFAKPKEFLKRFTGRVFVSEIDLYHVHGISRRMNLLCSDVVNWISEYRVYVVNGQIKHIGYCVGEKDFDLDYAAIERAVNLLCSSNDSYAGFCIDFGLLSTGETALIELNDGYSIGAYDGISADDFGELTFARWFELVSGSR